MEHLKQNDENKLDKLQLDDNKDIEQVKYGELENKNLEYEDLETEKIEASDYEYSSYEDEFLEEEVSYYDIVQQTYDILPNKWQTSQAEELKNRQNTGALRELIDIFENPNTANGNELWAEFFTSDTFLREQLSDEFAHALNFYLYNQDKYVLEELPQGFLTELAIAYGMTTEIGGYMYPVYGITMRDLIAKYWNMQTDEWRNYKGSKILQKIDNRARMVAFSDYITLRILESNGVLTEDNDRLWDEIVWHAGPHHLYEISKKSQGVINSIVVLKLFVYWIKNEDMPFFLAERMYECYQLKFLGNSSYYRFYNELKEVILQTYPDIEEKKKEKEEIKKWVFKLLELKLEFENRACVRFEPETEEETQVIKEHFEHDTWKLYWNHPLMMKQIVKKSIFYMCPLTVAQTLYDTYNLLDEPENKDSIVIKERTMHAIVNYKKALYYTGSDYWEYMFMRGFGCCYREISGDECYSGIFNNNDGEHYILGNRLYLPAYIKTKYRTNLEWQKSFAGYNGETGQQKNLNYYEFELADGKIIRAEYYLYYIAYYCDGKRVYNPIFSYEQLEEYEKNITKAEEFFFLVAMTEIDMEQSLSARKLILKWMSKTLLSENTFDIIADCIIQNNVRKKEICEYALLENESICLLLKRQDKGLQLFEYSDMGWKPRLLRAGLDWTYQSLQAVLQEHIKPVSKKIASFNTKGLSKDEKSKLILDALILYAKHEKGGNLTKPIVSDKYPELSKLFENGLGWLTDSFVVLKREISKNSVRKEVLYICVGDMGCYDQYEYKNKSEYDDNRLKELRNKVKRVKYENCILDGWVIRDNPDNRLFSWREPFTIGKNGKLYCRYSMAKLCETDSVLELISKMLDLENVVSCEVFEGKVLTSNQTGALMYCFSQQDYIQARTIIYENEWQSAYSMIKDEMIDMDEADDESDFENEYLEHMAIQRTKQYIKYMNRQEKYKHRCETLIEYYCDII